MNVEIVTTKEKLQDAFNVRKHVFVEEQQVPEEEEIDQYDSECTHFVLYDQEVPIGAGRFRDLNGIGKVERICVLSGSRNTGAGKLIMDKIEQYAKQNNYSALKLNAQTQAIPFYDKLGYEVISDEFMDAGIPHRTMKKYI
ncbi:GNAT family N-acetyltransferase [Robertmurraya korlensis]|uniref:GNAT family N-acetyltransferase n=1 Tax=Robertmurraya korlensis TaxID=519977 RepID=UPI000826966F|nr:GNAT family N-acetyltransferase [Robertmurraya korlensis]